MAIDKDGNITGTLEELLKFGFGLMDSKQYDQAAGVFQQLLTNFPKEPNSLYGLGMIAYTQQRTMDAKNFFAEVLTVLPDHIASLEALSVIAIQEQRWPEAEAILQRRLTLEPENPISYFNLGFNYQQQKNYVEAERYYQEALKRKPDYLSAVINLGVVYREQKQWSKAEALFEKALKIMPNYAATYMHLGGLHEDQQLWAAAQQRYNQALKIEPNNASILTCLGVLFQKQGHWEKARKYYLEALELDPKNVECRFNLSLLQLLLGEYAEGWENNQARKSLLKLAFRPSTKLEWWDGVASLRDKKIFLLPEQGYGDYLQLVRFSEALQAMGAEVIAVHDASVEPLLKTCVWLKDVISIKVYGEQTEGYQVLIGDLPRFLHIDATNIPATVPYFSALPHKIEQFSKKLVSDKPLKVGICWSGSKRFGADAARSMTFEDIKPLFGIKKVAWYNLTFPLAAKLEDKSCGIIDLSDEIKDFSDTAAVVEQLDLVISTDTALVHLVGAMNKPCWVMLPKVTDWRWQLDSYECPWYPSLTLFRQKRLGNWNDVVQAVIKALKHKLDKQKTSK